MKKTNQDLTTIRPVALSRREFMHGAGGVTLSLVLSLHDANAVTHSPNTPPRLIEGVGRPALGSSPTKGDLLQIPFWSDAATWNQPAYYETIQAGRRPFNKTVQSADIDGDGRDELLVRGLRGIFANRFSPAAGQWVNMPDGPGWSDAGGWDRAQFRQTMQTADINGDGQAELISLGNPTLYITEYHPDSQFWLYFPPGPALDTNGVLEQPQYYQTMQCADIDGDGQAELLVRGAAGLYVWKYNTAMQTWNQESLFTRLSDAEGWNSPQYYETLQCADIDGDGAAELLGRGPEGMYVWKFDPVAKTWSESAPFTGLSDANNWDQPQFYGTIQCADIDGDGKAELLGVLPASANVAAGMTAWKYNNGRWTGIVIFNTLTKWAVPVSDPRFPTYETIQCADIDGDGQAELLGRVGSGIQVFKYDPKEYLWNQLPDGPAWSDANGWNQVQFYATIQTARALKPGDPGYTGDGKHTQSVLIGRASRGMQTYRYDTAAQQWVNPTRPFPQFTGNAQAAYDYITTALNIQGTEGNGIRARYNDEAADWDGLIADLLGTGKNPVSPPPNNPEWESVKAQILNEMTWVKDVQKWYGLLSVVQMNSTFLSQELTLYTVGQYLQYPNDNGWQLALSILALIAGAMAAGLGFPELEAGAAAALVGILSNAISAAAEFLPAGGGSFQTQYNQLQDQLSDGFTAMITSLGTTQYAITGGIGGNGYVPGDYGLLKAMGQMIESTLWSWPSNTLNLVAAMQRGYAEEVFKILFTAYQANAGYYGRWMESEDVSNPTYYPPGYPANALFTFQYNGGPLIRWLTYYSNHKDWAPVPTLHAMFDPPQTGTVFPLGINTGDFYLAQNGWPTLVIWNISHGGQQTFTRARLPSLSADISVSALLTRDPATNQIMARLTVKNSGIEGATNVEIVETSLNRKRPLANLSRRRTHLIQGRSQVYTVNFPSLAQGATAILKVSGRYKGGTFGGSFRIKIP